MPLDLGILDILLRSGRLLHGPQALGRWLKGAAPATFLGVKAPLKLVLATVLAAAASFQAPIAMAIEEPKFDLIAEDGAFSLRRYAPVILAQTEVAGDLDHASSVGFRRVAGYIFGGNRPRGGGPAQKIAMTAPVTLEPQLPAGSGAAAVSAGSSPGHWLVTFTMPSSYRLDSLPPPTDPAVKLVPVPGHEAAVLRFSGWVDEDKFAARTAELQKWIAKRGLIAVGPPQLARYNPPWTLPFLRRNEVILDVKPAG